MKKTLIILLSSTFMFVSSCTYKPVNNQTNTNNMNPNATDSVVSPKIITVVDVRTPEEFAEGNINGSINVPLNLLEDSLVTLKNYNSIVVVCRSGKRSAKAKQILDKNGFTSVTDGKAWNNFNK